MQRRDFVTSTATGGLVAGAATAAGSFPTPAIAQGIKQLKMVTTWPKNAPGPGTGAENLAKRITAMSGGALDVKVFAAGELVPAFESFDAVSSGHAEMSHSASNYWQSKTPAFNFFATIPFGMTATEQAAWIAYGGGQELWDELCARFNVKPFPRASTGVQMGGWYRKEINTLEDFRGLKFRMRGFGGKVLRRLGATVINLPGDQILPALEAGTIDGTEWVGPWNDLAFGFYKVANFYYGPGFHEPSTTGEVLVNKGVWGEMTDGEKAIIEASVQAEAWREFAESNANNADSLKVLLDEHGVQLRSFSDELFAEIRKVAGEVVAEVRATDVTTKKVYDSYMAFQEKAIGWSRLSEQGYLNARSPIES